MEVLDDVFELLRKERRRFALYYLEDQNRPVHVDELSEKIDEWENDPDPSLSDDEYDDVVLTLKHKHLPKAAQTEFVHYGPEKNVVELTGSPSEFEVVLSVAEAIEQPRRDDVFSIT